MKIKNIRSLISQSLNIAAIFFTAAAIVMLLLGVITRELRLNIDVVCLTLIAISWVLDDNETISNLPRVIRKLMLYCILLAFNSQSDIIGNQMLYVVLNYALRAMVVCCAILAWLAQQYESGFEILDSKAYRFAFVTALQIAIIVRWTVHKVQRLFVKPRLGI